MEPNVPSSSWLKRCLVVFLAGGLLGFGLLWTPASPAVFGFSSYCRVCGLEQRTLRNQLPLSEVTLFERSVESPTLYSGAYYAGGGPSHAHDFVFAAGSGNGVKCAIGDGRQQQRGAQDPDRAASLRFVLGQVGAPELQRVYAQHLLVLRSPPLLEPGATRAIDGRRPAALAQIDLAIVGELLEGTPDEQFLALEEGLQAVLEQRAGR